MLITFIKQDHIYKFETVSIIEAFYINKLRSS